MSRRRPRRGFSLLELLIAVLVFALVFTAALRQHAEGNLPMQRMIHDYGVALNLCERFLNSLINDIQAGRLPPVGPERDVTEAVMERAGDPQLLRIFAGGTGQRTASLVFHLQVRLAIDETAKGLYRLTLRCRWGPQNLQSCRLESLAYHR